MAAQDESRDVVSWSMLIDKNIHYAKYVIYGVGIGGLVYAARSINLVTKFPSVSAIPEEYFRKQFRLNGSVKKVVPNLDTPEVFNVDIHVEHLPIVRLPQSVRSISRKYKELRGIAPSTTDTPTLCLRMPAVNVYEGYYESVAEKLRSRNVSFVLLERMKSSEEEVALSCIYFSEKGWLFRKKQDAGFWTVERGFGSVAPLTDYPELSKSSAFARYYGKLIKLEDKASSRSKGMWERNKDDRPMNKFRSNPRLTGFIEGISNRIKRASYKDTK